MKNLVFPYDILSDPLALYIKDAFLSTSAVSSEKSMKEVVNSQSKTINLWQLNEKTWHSFRLDVVLSGTREELEPFFQSSGPLTAAAVVHCRKTRLRSSVILKRSAVNPYAWEGSIEFDRRDLFGIMEVKGIISGNAAGRDYRFIAESDEWTIYLDEKYLPQISGSLPISWINFASDPNYSYLRKFATEPYYLNLEMPIPEVYLNKDIALLPELFSENQRGSRRAVHETLRTAVAKSVWLSLFQTSMDAVKLEEEGEEPHMPEEAWQVSVLKQILPKIYPGYSIEAALSAAVQDREAGNMRRIETLASAVIGKDIVREGKAVRTAVSELEIDYGGEQ